MTTAVMSAAVNNYEGQQEGYLQQEVRDHNLAIHIVYDYEQWALIGCIWSINVEDFPICSRP